MLRAATIALAVGIMAATVAARDDDRVAERERMVMAIELAAQAIGSGTAHAKLDSRVLEALRKVPRHKLVPPEAVPLAYADQPLQIGLGQTISQPYVVALMTHLLRVEPGDRVLEIGTGSGYQAAVLSLLAREIYSVEILEALGTRAAADLSRLGYANVKVRIGDGYEGWAEHAPYDRIIVTAAPDHVPPVLLRQLKPGGRMVIPVGPSAAGQDLMLIERTADGTTSTTSVIPVRFVPLTRDGRAR